jgi:hypothetical protein
VDATLCRHFYIHPPTYVQTIAITSTDHFVIYLISTSRSSSSSNTLTIPLSIEVHLTAEPHPQEQA